MSTDLSDLQPLTPLRRGPRCGRSLLLALFLAGLGAASTAGAQETTTGGRLPGDIELTVEPVHAEVGEPPVLGLGYRTVHEYPCYGYRIVANLERSADSLRLEIHGIHTGGPLCSPAFGPATGGVHFDVPAGTYALTVRHRDSVDTHTLEVGEERVRLVPGRVGFTVPDTRPRWLFPERSFALYCGTTEERASLCARVAAWIEELPGLTAFSFAGDGEDGEGGEDVGDVEDVQKVEGGVIPYRRLPGTQHKERHVFRYAEEGRLSPVWGCMERLARRTAPLKGIRLGLETWTGQREPPAPEAVEAPACVPSLPDPDAAHARALVWEDAAAYDVAWDRRRGYDPDRAPADRVAAWDGRVMVAHPRPPEPPPAPRADTVDGEVRVTVPLPVTRPGAGEDGFGQGRRSPVILPPDRYTDALPRDAFHARLEEWWMRGGRTVGDPGRHPDRPWVWAEDELEWYFLLGESTDAGVRAYLDLVERHGTDLAWRVEEEGARSPQRVRVGPDGVLVPGFFFYRWRD